jgi:hypothetical protein
MRFAAELLLLSLMAGAPVEIGPGSTADFATAAEGARILTVRDVFVAAMSPFDRSARLKTDRQVPEEEYLAFVSRQTRDWTETETGALRGILERFRSATASLDLPLPPIVHFVKTTGDEEGHAAYCRDSAVILPANVIGGDPAELRKTVFHELFHIYSRHHPEKRAALYRILGFEVCPEVALPEVLRHRKITNPDAPLIDSVIRVTVAGKPRPVTPVLLATTERYDVKKGGEFFDQMQFRLLVLEETGGGFRPAASADGRPQLLEAGAVDYLDQVGRNTTYIIHPEEILADNFVLLIQSTKPALTPAILEKLRALLGRKEAHAESGSMAVSPAVVATSFASHSGGGTPQLRLLVLWRGEPGWFVKPESAGSHETGSLSSSAGRTGMDRAVSRIEMAGVVLEAELDVPGRRARLGSQELDLGDANVALVDGVDEAGGFRMAGLLRVDPAFASAPDLAPILGRSEEIVAFLRCESRVEDPAVDALLHATCARLPRAAGH